MAAADYGKNDVWGLGMILHALLSSAGHTPFEQMAEPATYSGIPRAPLVNTPALFVLYEPT